MANTRRVTVAWMTFTGVGPVLSLMVRAAIERVAHGACSPAAGLVADVDARVRVRDGC